MKETTAKTNEKGFRQQTYKKGEFLPMDSGDLHAVLTLGITALKRGARAKYSADTTGLQEFIYESQNYLEYVNTVNSNPDIDRKLIIDVESWCVFLGITRETLRQYSARNKDWKEFIDYFKEIIVTAKKQLAFNGKIPPMIAVFDLTNNHNYHNTSEFHLDTTPPEEEPKLSAEELIQEAQKLVGFKEIDATENEPK